MATSLNVIRNTPEEIDDKFVEDCIPI